MKDALKGAMLVFALVFARAALAHDTGTLIAEVAQVTSEKELPKKVDKQLRNGDWNGASRTPGWCSRWSPSSSSTLRSTTSPATASPRR